VRSSLQGVLVRGRRPGGHPARRALACLGLVAGLLGGCSSPPPAAPAASLVRSPGKEPVELIFGGDVSYARGVASVIRKRGKGDPGSMLAPLAPVLSGADLALVNLESVAAPADLAPAAAKKYLLRADPAHFTALPRAGIDAVTLANNHVLDYGRPAVLQTLEALRLNGVAPLGLRHGPAAAQEPLLAEVGKVRFALLAYNAKGYGAPRDFFPRPFDYDRAQIRRDIQAARARADHVVVTVHWGDEYDLQFSPRQQEEGRLFIDAGAILVVGHHPHVPQGVEEYGGGLVAYSLGNLLFDMISNYKVERTRRSFLLTTTFDRQRLLSWKLLPIQADRYFRPKITPTVDVESFVLPPPRTTFRFSSALATLQARRLVGEATQPCATWKKRAPVRENQYMQWFAPRWACPDDAAQPWLTVAVTSERSGGVLRRGLWAHPHAGGPLQLSFPAVPLTASLAGHVGVPDYPLTLVPAGTPPARLTVRLAGEELPLLEQPIPFVAGWMPLRVDTARFAGATREVTVEVSGPLATEHGLVFDLLTEQQQPGALPAEAPGR